MALPIRNWRGRFVKKAASRKPRNKSSVQIEHNYSVGNVCDKNDCQKDQCSMHPDILKAKNVSADGWRSGRRIIELEVLLSSLKYCQVCRLGPVPLTSYNIIGEMRRGLSGYIYVKCQNPDCGEINRVPYGKTHRLKKSKPGMPCFAVNTKLRTAMVDSIGGPVRVNNFFSTLNMPAIQNKNLKHMERRAGDVIETVSCESTRAAAEGAFKAEMA